MANARNPQGIRRASRTAVALGWSGLAGLLGSGLTWAAPLAEGETPGSLASLSLSHRLSGVERPAPAAPAAWIVPSATERALTLTLSFPQAPVGVQAEPLGRDLLLRFNQPLPGQAPKELLKQLPGWLDDTQAGADFLLLRAAREVTFAVTTPSPGRVQVKLSAQPAPVQVASAAPVVRSDAAPAAPIAPAPGRTGPQTIGEGWFVCEVAEEGTTLSLTWPSGSVTFEQEADSRELLLRFSQPLPVQELFHLPEWVPEWFADVRSGYDSLLIRSSRPVSYEVESPSPGRVTVRMKRLRQSDPQPEAGARRDKGDAGPPSGRSDKVDPEQAERTRIEGLHALRVELLRAKALAESGQTGEARAILEQLMEAHPERVEVYLALAEVESRFGSWRQAVTLYNRALALVEDEEAAKAKSRVLYEHGQRVSGGLSWQDNRNSDRQWIESLSGRWHVGDWTSLGVTQESRLVQAPLVTDAHNHGQPFDGWRSRLRFELNHDLNGGREVTGLLFAPEGDAPGLGLDLSNRDRDQQQWRLELRLHEPWWTTLSSLVAGGSADRITGVHERRLTPRVAWNVQGGLNAYTIDDARWGATTTSASTGIRYEPIVNDGYYSLGYRLDYEAPLEVKQRTDDLGAWYTPVDVARRMVHTVEVVGQKELSDYLDLQGSLGYSKDLYGGSGPNLSLGTTWRPTTPWEVGLGYSYNALSARGGKDSAVSLVDMRVTRHF